MRLIDSMDSLADHIAKMLDKDRYVLMVCTGETGEGKSCFTTKMAKKVAKRTNTPFSYKDNITFLRAEIKLWVDGDEKGNHRMIEKSCFVADELISMFFKRTWYDEEQIDGVELFNKCRDRHLFISGNIPSFWDLDSALYSVITLRVHIPKRGIAWVSQKSSNPYTADSWYKKLNEKLFEKHNHPYKCRGFLCEIHYDDWTLEEKKEYYEVRNTKRLNTEGQRKKKEKYSAIKEQRNILIQYIKANVKGITDAEMADLIGLDTSMISKVVNNVI